MTKTLNLSLLTLLLASSSVAAMTEEQQLAGLEAVKAWEVAYPVALKVADQHGNYADWRKVAVQYADYDQNGLAYLKAWQQAEKDKQEDHYRDFISLRPQTTLSTLAVHRIFQSIDAKPDANAYIGFIENFHDYPESLVALNRLHGLLYARATVSQKPEEYDRFIATFPEAAQAKEAEETALRLERETLSHDLVGADENRKEHLATALFNQALVDEQAAVDPTQVHRRLSALRKFHLLQEIPEFAATHTRTEQLLRAENIQRFKALETSIQQEHVQTRELIEKVRLDLVTTVTAQYSQLHEQITTQGQTLEAALNAHQQALDRQLTQVNNDIAKLNGGLAETQRQLSVSRNQSDCNGLMGCGLRVALDVISGNTFAQVGVSLLTRIPVIKQLLQG